MDRFEAFSSACAPVSGAQACERFASYLRERGAGARLAPARLAAELALDLEEQLEDMLELALSMGLLTQCPQVRCQCCAARIDQQPLLRAFVEDGEARCPDCDEPLSDPGSLPAELRYCLSGEAEQEALAFQERRAARPPGRAVVLCALTVELAAVRAQMDANGPVSETTVRGGDIHLLGSFDGAHVRWQLRAVLCEPTNEAAAAALANAVNAFDPDVALFVGVAGGIASKGVALGDVVAATDVVGYEGGKDTEHGLQPRPAGFIVSHDLRQLAKHTLHEPWQQRILPAPGATMPAAHAEPIAAGAKVVASAAGETAKLIAQVAPRAVAVEMEGAGFLEAARRHKQLSASVIRGVSDLLDGKAEADAAGSQQRAAANAAAFAFELLYRFQPPAV